MRIINEYNAAWAELNTRLRGIEDADGGLYGALAGLETHQRQSGFIRDFLENVERWTFYHPDDPNRFFRAQYNPKRALRFSGNGVAAPPSGIMASNEGCFLCRDNIQWQQRGSQMGYEIRLGESAYYAWMNPFPLLPCHVVIATQAHTSQDWGITQGARLGRSILLSDLAALAMRLPGYIGYYNGVDAGASIPGHMHLHFCRRPEGHSEFPLERAARQLAAGDGDVGLLTDYPVAAAVWRGEPAQVIDAASDWLSQWTHRNRARLAGLTCNLIVTKDWSDDGFSLYFVPRDRSKSRVKGLNGLIGGLEILGEVVLSTLDEKKRLDDGAIDYFALEDYLSRVHTPMFPA